MDIKDLQSLAKVGGVVPSQAASPTIGGNVAFLKEIRETVSSVMDMWKMFNQAKSQGQGVKAMTQISQGNQSQAQSGDVNPPKSSGGGGMSLFPFIMAIVEREISEGRGNKPITPNSLVELVKKSMGG